MFDFSGICEKYLNKLGKPSKIIYKNGSEEDFFAVVEQTWKKNKVKFEDKAGLPGRTYNEYCSIIVPKSVTLNELSDDDLIEIDGCLYQLKKCEKVVIKNNLQFFRGIIKRIYEEDENVFS